MLGAPETVPAKAALLGSLSSGWEAHLAASLLLMGSVGTASTGGVGLAWSEEALQPHWSGFGPAQTLSEQDKADELIEGVSVDYAPAAAASATPVDTWTFCFYAGCSCSHQYMFLLNLPASD